ncbi:NADPH2:quinone reductase [Arthrobacter bambusae]|nr:NADPH2:quinone reductase [Arthrobacter bambusae]
MRFRTAGGPETLITEELPDPVPRPGEVLIDVASAGINRTDVLQREGGGHLPTGASDIFGLEVAGRVAALGAPDERSTGLTRGPGEWVPQVGDEIVALLDSGAYATRAIARAGHVLLAPRGTGLIEAGGLIEAAATVVSNISMIGGFAPGDTVLIHGATGGVGAFAIQYVKALGGRVAVTASSPEKLRVAEDLGADLLINYTSEDFAERTAAAGGADIILDTVGGMYLEANLRALAPFGRIVTIGTQGGHLGQLDFRLLLAKKASIHGTLLRDRNDDQKTAILAEVRRIVWPLLEDGHIRMPIDSIFALEEAAAAHEHFGRKNHIGKILLVP